MPAAVANAPGILGRIERARRELLDLSARNRLVSTPRGPSRGRKIDVVDERTEEVFRLLVAERKSMSFLPGAGEDQPGEHGAENPSLAQPEEVGPGAGAPDPRHTDLRLQTRLKSEALQARLLAMYYDAQTYEQEQGVSILYLAAGFLRWYESPTSDTARYAPLLLLPVDLERPSAAGRFHVRLREEDIATNLSLRAKLKAEFGIDLPEVPDAEELSPTAYFEAVHGAVAGQPRWDVLPDDMVLWFFSFAKYLMYRDLDPASWPAHAPLGSNPVLSSLLGDGFPGEPPLFGEDEKIDRLIPPEVMVHVTDADSSQAVVIEEVRRGRHLVVQGPPGTGKSQTITNLIAGAVKEGKKVLFVAEKMAALDVVRGRLERLGLGPMCLELHSSKASKKAVLEELARTLALGRPRTQAPGGMLEALKAAIARLNGHAEVMNTPVDPSGLTPYQVIGRLAALYGRGVEASNLGLAGLESWTADLFRARCRDVEELQAYLESLGAPADHPWRGVRRVEPILHAELRELADGLVEAIKSLDTVVGAATELERDLGLPAQPDRHLRDVQQLAQYAIRLVNVPPMDRDGIRSPVWDTKWEHVAELIERGQTLDAGRSVAEGKVADVAWRTDLSATRRHLAGHGRSLFRWFVSDYRAAVVTLKGILKGEPPRSLAERLEIVDAVISVQETSRALDEDPSVAQLGRDAFGAEWRGSRSDWGQLAQIVAWDRECRDANFPWDHWAHLARLDSSGRSPDSLRAVIGHLEPVSGRLQQLVESIELDVADAFGRESISLVPIHDLLARLRRWGNEQEGLSKWIGYEMRRRRLALAGLAPLVAGLHEGLIAAGAAADQLRVSYYQALIRDILRRYAGLAGFDGQSHGRWVEEFRALDRARLETARGEVATAHHDAIPHAATGGEMAVIRREIEKKRRHKPIRVLLREAGTAALAIKPVFLMSPISVAQYLEPGGVTFDLLLIDEASQVSPVDALGAMARARQVVVVGDDKQLPPTRFFSKILDDGGVAGDAEGDLDAGDLESVLGLCVAQGLAQRMLRWHYRSRHHSLIAVSNREFYENRLQVVPSPTAITAMHGLHFRHVRDGVFDRGNTATNRVEARAVAEAVIEHARGAPKNSLGVGCFSVAQRDAIRDELELLQRNNPQLAGFFSPGRAEPFFVKNLENIQGDERDVIFISVGYARDLSGTMAMNFGPLSGQGGERRLNVLISRARERCEVFASITHDDIDLQRARSRGAAAFKTFLGYAATGVLDHEAPTGGDFDSDFERQVAAVLRSLGHEVHCQVGTARFIIDLAVVDQARPGRYLLGIECDGASYHSSRSARDRDRIREAVLRDRGWKMHRIWSTDWFHRPGEQLRRVADAIERARVETQADEGGGDEAGETKPADLDPACEIERSEPVAEEDAGQVETWASPYVEADIDVPSGTPIHETSPALLAEIVARVIEIEGPVHRDEVTRRMTSLWGLQRTGARIADATSAAIDAAARSGRVRCDADFLSRCGMDAVPVRCRDGVKSAGLRRPEMLPPAEVREAILRLAAGHIGLGRDELAAMVTRTLGFRSTGAKLREVIEGVVQDLVDGAAIELRDGRIYLR